MKRQLADMQAVFAIVRIEGEGRVKQGTAARTLENQHCQANALTVGRLDTSGRFRVLYRHL